MLGRKRRLAFSKINYLSFPKSLIPALHQTQKYTINFAQVLMLPLHLIFKTKSLHYCLLDAGVIHHKSMHDW